MGMRSGIASGGSILVGKYLGSGDMRTAKKVISGHPIRDNRNLNFISSRCCIQQRDILHEL